ncbi:hypothetical protein [Planotetraspora phitsanulokensis]|uniref:hypothetical protein n=1 Tax=Planotetraspora phitsanulokensis TaxID=575192 RepID=UPI00194EE63C|nr:hypothetical protein [Planotetraspora phitsanulokensis]
MIEFVATGAGDRYHVREDCSGLRAGRLSGEVQGYEQHDVHRFATAELAEAAGWTPCGVCVTGGPPDE